MTAPTFDAALYAGEPPATRTVRLPIDPEFHFFDDLGGEEAFDEDPQSVPAWVELPTEYLSKLQHTADRDWAGRVKVAWRSYGKGEFDVLLVPLSEEALRSA